MKLSRAKGSKYELNHEGATRKSTYILFCDKTRVQMFYFDSKTTRPNVPFLWAALVFQKAYIDRKLFGYAECTDN